MAGRKSKVVAPYTARLGKKSGGPVSFNAYFLRDMYSKGKLSEKVIKEIVSTNGIKDATLKDIMSAIKKTDGSHITKNVSVSLAAIADVVADMN